MTKLQYRLAADLLHGDLSNRHLNSHEHTDPSIYIHFPRLRIIKLRNWFESDISWINGSYSIEDVCTSYRRSKHT